MSTTNNDLISPNARANGILYKILKKFITI